MRRIQRAAAIAAAGMLALAGCSSGGTSTGPGTVTPPNIPKLESLGAAMPGVVPNTC